MTTFRASPVFHELGLRRSEMVLVRGMACAVRIDAGDEGRADGAGICDFSALERIGLKGPAAADWLAVRGVPVPEEFNSWLPLPGGGLVARLARTEFLVEDGPEDRVVPALRSALAASAPEGIYPVLRQDCAIALTGASGPEMLRQACNVDFAPLSADSRQVILTQMVGVSVTALRRDLNGRLCFRLWCEYTSGQFFWATLVGIAEDLGGGPVGTACVWPELHAG